MIRLDADAIRHRSQSLSIPRFGVSVVAGMPFTEPMLQAIRDLHSDLSSLIPRGLFLPKPERVHVTVLRSHSSPNPLDHRCRRTLILADALTPRERVSLAWSQVTLDIDGAIRAYATPPMWPFPSFARAEEAAYLLSEAFSIKVSVQQRLWLTLASLGTEACELPAISRVPALLQRVQLPSTPISRLQLVCYNDLQFTDVTVISVYELK